MGAREGELIAPNQQIVVVDMRCSGKYKRRWLAHEEGPILYFNSAADVVQNKLYIKSPVSSGRCIIFI
jgi:hypothetical protein